MFIKFYKIKKAIFYKILKNEGVVLPNINAN